MAAPCSTPSSRASAKRARQQARRAESLSGSIRQVLTPEVWKPARQAAPRRRLPQRPTVAAVCRTDRCRTVPHGAHLRRPRPWPQAEAPRKGLQRVPQGRAPPAHDRRVGRRRGRAPPTRAHPGRPYGRRRRDRLRVRRHAPRVPAHPATGGRPGAGEQAWQCTDALDHGAGEPPDRGALVLAVGDGQGGRASALARPPGGPPPAPWRRSCWSARVQSRHCQGFPRESCGFLPTRAFSSAANAARGLKNEPASR